MEPKKGTTFTLDPLGFLFWNPTKELHWKVLVCSTPSRKFEHGLDGRLRSLFLRFLASCFHGLSGLSGIMMAEAGLLFRKLN